MPFTNLNKKIDSLNKSGVSPYKTKRKGKFFKKLILILLILAVLFYFPARGIYSASRDLVQSARLLNQGVSQNNLDTIKQGLTGTKNATTTLNSSLNWFFWAGFIPFFGSYYSDAKHFAQAAQYELEAGEILVNSLDPHKNELGLNGQPTPGQDKIAQAVKVLEKIMPELDKVEPKLKLARQEVESINTDKYPSKFGTRDLQPRVEQAKQFIIGAHIAVSEARDAIQIAPNALGQPTAKTYLLLFQNDKELRATGGFITAFATLKLDKGHLSTTTSDDIYRLDEKLLATCQSKVCGLTPPDPIVKYLPEVTGKKRSAWSMRDSNISPDLPTSIKEFERMYQLLGQGLPFDGIITIDTQVVEELITITGPIDVNNTTYSANNDPRCNCPNVIYELEHYAEIAAKGQEDRKEVVGTLMQLILARILGSGPDKLPEFITVGAKLANHKHVMFYMHDPKHQAALSRLGWTGEIDKNPKGDYLHINDSNFAGGKSNLYVEEKVVDEITEKDGKVTHKLTIEYKNPQPFNVWLNGILRDYVRIYVPKGSTLITSKGSEDPVTTKEDEGLNKTYFEAFITVRPQNSRVLSFEYEVPVKMDGDSYDYVIQKQPGAKDHRYTVKINGRTKKEFELIDDQNLQL